MGKKYLLPTLNKEEDVICDNCFEKIDEIYDFLLNRLRLHYEPNESVFDGGSNAMPHIYEQMLLFNEAFFDANHPEHKRAIIEWRAVLAIMALQRVRNLKLEAVKVNLSENVTNPFLRAAASFKPEEEPVFYQTTWDFLYVLCIDETPIALFSPLTVVCPAKMFKQKINKLTWIKISKVNGKEELLFRFHGKENEYANLGAWLKMLEKNLKCSDSDHSNVSHFYKIVKNELKIYMQKYSQESDQEINTLFKKDIYDSINNSIRREYEFLNNCCDFSLDNPKMNFLIERYKDDIFQQKILVFVYDDKPDAMFERKNLPKIENIFDYVMEIDQRRIIQVSEPGGERLAAYALIPFKQSFVSELIENEITAEEFFEEYTVIYNQAEDRLEVNLGIKGFNYSFYKTYQSDKWERVYGKEFISTYLWPKEKINALDWKHYYTYIYKNYSEIDVDIPNAKSSILYEPKTDSISKKGNFKLICTEEYPPYIRYSYKSVSGYLPIKANHVGMQDTGGTASVFIDIGHTSTYVTLLKTFDENSGRMPERINFRIPSSIRVTGEKGKDNSAKYNFIIPESEWSESYFEYFRNIIYSFYLFTHIPNNYSVNAFEDGQIVFPNDFSSKILGDKAVNFIDFDYDCMKQETKRYAHIFVEQIVIYAIYETLLHQCSCIKINFLHCYEEEKEEEKIGQLEGLWKHALMIGKNWTGISTSFASSVEYMGEHEALTYYLYKKMMGQMRNQKAASFAETEDIFVSVDIGWRKTLVSHLYLDEKKDYIAKYAKISFGGYDISMVNSKFDFQRYNEILSILLTGSCEVNVSSFAGKMIQEFSNIYLNNKKDCEDYHYGLFDLIAMEIERNNFAVPPDVYNNMEEYRNFIKMITYNMLLLFLNIGYILGKMRRELKAEKKHIHIYLGGNGAKFLKWITNSKDYNIINEENENKAFIIGTKGSGILDVVKNGFAICGTETDDLTCTIELVSKMKEQMTEGYIFSYEKAVPHFQPQYVENKICKEEQDFKVNEEESKKKVSTSNPREQSQGDGDLEKNNDLEENDDLEENSDLKENDNLKKTTSIVRYLSRSKSELSEIYGNIYQLRQAFFFKGNETSEDKNRQIHGLNTDIDIGKIIRTDSQNVCCEIIRAINEMKSN